MGVQNGNIWVNTIFSFFKNDFLKNKWLNKKLVNTSAGYKNTLKYLKIIKKKGYIKIYKVSIFPNKTSRLYTDYIYI